MLGLNAQVVEQPQDYDTLYIDSENDDDDFSGIDDEALLDSLIEALISAEEEWSGSLMDRLQQVKREAERNPYTTGICIYDLTADSVIFRHNANKMLKPASTEKLFTGITALSTLGTDHKFRTNVGYRGTIMADSVGRKYLHGDICLIGGFDPTLEYADVYNIAQGIREMQIDSIDGRILVDMTIKKTLMAKNGWTWERIPLDYEYFITPLSYNKACATTSAPNMTGYKAGARVKHPELYFIKSVYETLKVFGIQFEHKSSVTACDTATIDVKTMKPVFAMENSISKIMPRMMKNSDNYYAECMFLQLGDHSNPTEWRYNDGVNQVKKVMMQAGGNVADMTIIDGSGLSHSNRATPENEVLLLKYAYRNSNIFDMLYETLPIAGVDGTLGSRMTDGAAHRNVRAKTGTISGVSTLAGYVRTSQGHMLAFSIMNNGLKTSSIGRAFQNKVCQTLAK